MRLQIPVLAMLHELCRQVLRVYSSYDFGQTHILIGNTEQVTFG